MPGRAARAPRPDPCRPCPARATPTERWLSGRKHRTRNAAYGQPYRGFESHPLRHCCLIHPIAAPPPGCRLRGSFGGESCLASLELMGVRKAFGTTPILDDVSLSLESREFIAFLGPSGSGKSTLLRIIAGLETADAGEVWLEGRRIDTLPPGQRGIAMVFQALCALPAHERSREYGVRPQERKGPARGDRPPRRRRRERCSRSRRLLDRKPAEMSGGQRQRVAIGRALVKEPKLFLLDEPLSNLDAALRLRTRVELAQLKQKVDAAVIMVTHDQAEAMTLADRIVVMNDRRIQQVGAPMEIYSPAREYVRRAIRRFAGDDAAARVELVDGGEFATRQARRRHRWWRRSVPRAGLPPGELRIGLRPEAVRVSRRCGDHQRQGRTGRAAGRANAGLCAARRRPADHRGGRGRTAASRSATRSRSRSTAPRRISSGRDGTGYHRAGA